jgi:drug/metabolite transporter (DMT)-like permease
MPVQQGNAPPELYSASPATARGVAHRRAGLSLAIGAFGIAWSAILVRWSGVPGLVSAFYRLAFAAAVFVPWRLLAPRQSTRSTPAAVRAAIIAGILFGADLAFFNSAVMQTSAANATLIGVNAPIFVAFGSWAMRGERPTARFWLGFVLALFGMVSIVGADVVLHPRLGFGDALALAGAACYGFYLIYVEEARRGMDTLTLTAWSTGIGAAGLWVVCLIARQPLLGLGVRAWAALVGLALASQVIGQLLVAHALGRLTATLTSIVLLSQAPATALLAWPLLGEPIRAGQVLGGALVLAGIAVVTFARTPGQADLARRTGAV